ncbi:MAG: hypothetical protein QNK31_12050 [Porticoccus sp.]|nr:hypothetical protein [Porticoccus sp.]
MKIHVVLFAFFAAVSLVACSSAEEKKDEAQAEYTQEKTETLKEYKECVKEAGEDAAKMSQCEALLKAVTAVEGGK